MKALIKSIFVAAILACGFSQSFAAVDMFIKITDIKGESKVVKLTCSNGACATTVDDMTAGKFTATLCDSKGNPLALKVKEKGNRTKSSLSMNFAKITFEYSVKAPRDVATGQSSGKRSSTGEPSNDVNDVNRSVKSPRDAASGQATGKRQHGSVKIVKEWGASSKSFIADGNVDEDCDMAVKVSWSWTDGKTMAMDDWESPVVN